MHIEVEVKLKVDNLCGLESQIRALAESVSKDCQEDIYFFANKVNVNKRNRFRVRRNGKSAVVTFKENDRIEDGPFGTEFQFQICEETEFEVNDSDAFISFLYAFGFIPSTAYRKHRSIYRLGNLRIELNEVDDIGAFVEIEALCKQEEIELAKAEIVRFTNNLGLQLNKSETRWYTDLLNK